MPALQGVIGPGVVEVLDTLDLVKRVHRVALQTVLSKLVVMHILVTAGTFSVGETCEFLRLYPILLRFFMTEQAINAGMLAPQRELGRVMIKFRGWSKVFKIVAGGTI